MLTKGFGFVAERTIDPGLAYFFCFRLLLLLLLSLLLSLLLKSTLNTSSTNTVAAGKTAERNLVWLMLFGPTKGSTTDATHWHNKRRLLLLQLLWRRIFHGKYRYVSLVVHKYRYVSLVVHTSRVALCCCCVLAALVIFCLQCM